MQTPSKLSTIPLSRKRRCFDSMNGRKAFDFGVGLNMEINGGQWLPPLDSGSTLLIHRGVLVARKSPPVEGFPVSMDGGISGVNKQSSSQFSEAFSPNQSSKMEREDSDSHKKKMENKPPPRKNKHFWPKIDDKSKPQKTPKNASTPNPKAKRGRKPKVSTSRKESPISEPQMPTYSPNSSPPCPVTPTTIHEPLLRKLEQTPDKEHGCCLTALRNVTYATYGDMGRNVSGNTLNLGRSCRRALDFGFEDQVEDSDHKDEYTNDIEVEGVKEDPRMLRAKLWKKSMSFFEGKKKRSKRSCRRALDFGFEDQVEDSDHKDGSTNDIVEGVEGVKEDPRMLRAKLWKKNMSFLERRKKRSKKKWLKTKSRILDSLIKHFKSLSCGVREEIQVHTCSSSPTRQNWDCKGENQARLHPKGNQNGSNISTVEGSQIISEKEKKDIERALVKYQLKGKSEMIVYNKKKKYLPKVDFDHETIRVWNLLMTGVEDIPDPEDEKTKAWWAKERKNLRDNVKIFIPRMRFIQGNRQFSRWKGSVVDSVVGVFLTQNVSDVLSSSAFMSLASKYPVNYPHSNDNGCGDDHKDENPNAKDQNHEQNNKCGDDVKDQTQQNECEDKDALRGDDDGKDQKQQNGCEDEDALRGDDVKNQQRKSKNGQHQNPKNWDDLRKKYSTGKPRDPNTYDSVDYEALRRANVEEISEVIKDRGQNIVLAKRIKGFLERIFQDHGNIDLEWLRDVPPHDAKEYLLSIEGIGLKSTECIRLLCLQHHAFPVDTNVARVAVRLGWIPLKTLPENILFHELDKYPSFDVIQKYLWARLSDFPQDLLYELHYHMITAGKVFCPKVNPNCNVCPMKEHCKYFASKFASVKLQLPEPQEETKAETYAAAGQDHTGSLLENNYNSNPSNGTSNSEPIIEFPASPGPVSHNNLETDIEDLCCKPVSPGPVVSHDNLDRDIEDLCYSSNNDDVDDEEIPTIVLNPETFKQNLLEALEKNKMAHQNSELAKAIVAISPENASIPPPKSMSLHKLRTVLRVYELNDDSPILIGFEKRVPEDPSPYLFRMWTTGELQDTVIPECKEYNEQIVFGSILIPCRTANRGSFPLGGTYFQPNEVFADYESSRIPIPVHRDWLWNRPMSFLYCGTMVSSIHRGFSNIMEVQQCCRFGYYCSRGFDRETRDTRPLSSRFHPPNKVTANKKGTSKNNVDE